MNSNVIASFEKANGNQMKVTTKARRNSIPGRIEREEILRAEKIEMDADLRIRRDRNSWYNLKVV